MHGLTRTEQYALLAMILFVAAGLGWPRWDDGAPETLVHVEGQGTWQRLDLTQPPTMEPGRVTMPVFDAAPAPGGPRLLDLNRANAAELDSLPGIGPAYAARILELRAQLGGFESIEQLDAVPGISDRTLDPLRPWITIGPRPPATPRLATDSSPTPLATPAPTPAPQTVNVNTAEVQALQTIHGVGPVLAERIVQDRARHGAFRQAEDLLRVEGIGPKTLEKMRGQLRF